MCALGGDDGPPKAMRYSELARLLAGVSQKMLTQTLRSLERDGLLARTVTPTVPVTVTYELTDPRTLAARTDARDQGLGADQHGRGLRTP
ncbi:winged helix-turn-helix transcriptional regulator [Lentzea rhizosphaerae]|uniref:Winged helix-turn-helix transcriptional regulator n=1 Tax=Lentzea rhizosphaerae TaxID=2041025 RepID=A0ABV8C2I2_9PSEU